MLSVEAFAFTQRLRGFVVSKLYEVPHSAKRSLKMKKKKSIHIATTSTHRFIATFITFIKHICWSLDTGKKLILFNSVYSQFSPNYKLVLKLAHSSPITLAFSLNIHTLYKMSLHLYYRTTYFYIGSRGGDSQFQNYIASEAIIYFKNTILPLANLYRHRFI